MEHEAISYNKAVNVLIDKFQDQITDDNKLSHVIEALCYLLAHSATQVDTDMNTFLADIHNTVLEHITDMKKEYIQ
jgi:hypothetical protein